MLELDDCNNRIRLEPWDKAVSQGVGGKCLGSLQLPQNLVDYEQQNNYSECFCSQNISNTRISKFTIPIVIASTL